MLQSLNGLSSQLSQLYTRNNSLLAESMARIASGKKVNKPSDDVGGYMRSKSLLTDVSQYEDIKENLVEAQGKAKAALSAGNAIFEDLNRMKEVAELWATGSSDEKAAYSAEFDALKASVTNTINSAYYDTTQLYAAGTLSSVDVDPAGTNSFDMFFVAGDIADASSLAASNGTAAVQTEIDKVTTYVAKASSYEDQTQTHMDISDSVINSKESVISAITDVDDAKELARATDLQVRQQAAVAMMAQANMAREGIVRLFQ